MRLVDFPYVVVRLDCNLCHRKGAYRLARLAVAFGAEAYEIDFPGRHTGGYAVWKAKPFSRSGRIFTYLPARQLMIACSN